ncbi:MAG: hypothetical protein K6L81_14070 [Agarilytica sp.]
MKLIQTNLLFFLFAYSIHISAGFEARIGNNNSNTATVKPHLVDKSKYARSDALTTSIPMQFRGGCSSGHTLKKFDLKLGNSIYNIPVSGNNRNISGNKGQSWATHNASNFTIPADHPGLISACNNHISQKLSQGYDLETLLSSDSQLSNIETSIDLQYQSKCNKNASVFNPPPTPWTQQDTLRVKVRCKATGYEEPVNIDNIQFSIDKTVTLGGACKVKLKGALTTSKPNQTVRFRYEHVDKDFNRKLSSIHQVTTDQQGYKNFSHNYSVANGPGKEKGKIRIIGVSHSFQSAQKSYTMNCIDPATSSLQQATPSTIKLKAKPVNNSKKAFGNQLCPTKVKFIGTIKAGSNLNGQAVFIGQSLADIQAKPFSIQKGQTKKVNRVRQLNWTAPASSTLTLGGGGSAAPLMTQNVMQGLNIVGQNNQPILSYPRKSFTVSCSLPSVMPGVQIPAPGFSAVPNHTGGGAPTDLQTTQPIIPKAIPTP